MPLNLLAFELFCWLQQRKEREKIAERRKTEAQSTARQRSREAEHTAWENRQVCAAV